MARGRTWGGRGIFRDLVGQFFIPQPLGGIVSAPYTRGAISALAKK